jgi:hypothetical protein
VSPKGPQGTAIGSFLGRIERPLSLHRYDNGNGAEPVSWNAFSCASWGLTSLRGGGSSPSCRSLIRRSRGGTCLERLQASFACRRPPPDPRARSGSLAALGLRVELAWNRGPEPCIYLYDHGDKRSGGRGRVHWTGNVETDLGRVALPPHECVKVAQDAEAWTKLVAEAFADKQTLKCPFPGCSFEAETQGGRRRHIRMQHIEATLEQAQAADDLIRLLA